MDNALGLKIRKVRELKNIGQQYMAEQLRISQSSYSDIENGKTRISEEKLEQIARILDVQPEAIKNFNDAVIFNNSPQSGYFNTNYYNPVEKMQELYERLLKEKDEQISGLKATISRLQGE